MARMAAKEQQQQQRCHKSIICILIPVRRRQGKAGKS